MMPTEARDIWTDAAQLKRIETRCKFNSSQFKNHVIMNALRNRVQLIGHLGMDPEVKTFDNDRKLARLAVATNEVYYNSKGEKVEDTQWHNIVMWGKIAEIAEKYLKKGQEVALEGKLVNRSWETKEGDKRYTTEVVASEFVMLGKKEAAA